MAAHFPKIFPAIVLYDFVKVIIFIFVLLFGSTKIEINLLIAK